MCLDLGLGRVLTPSGLWTRLGDQGGEIEKAHRPCTLPAKAELAILAVSANERSDFPFRQALSALLLRNSDPVFRRGRKV
jgi:hypothetical protein